MLRLPSDVGCLALGWVAGALVAECAFWERVPLLFAVETEAGPPSLLGPSAALALLAWGHDRRGRMLLLAFFAACALGHWDRAAAEWKALQLPLPGLSRELHLVGTLLRPPERGADGEWSFPAVVRGESGVAWTVNLRVGASQDVGPSSLVLARLVRGDRFRCWARLRGPRPARPADPSISSTLALRARGLDSTAWIKSARLIRPRFTDGPWHPARWIDRTRSSCRARLDRWLGTDSEPRAIAGAMLLGDRRAIGPRTRRDLMESGLSHLIAISGLHVGLVWGAFAALARRFRHGNLAIALVSIVALPAFGYFVGARPSVMRAILFTGLALAASTLGRKVGALHVLTLTGVLSLAGQPSIWASGGFQLSFAATAGLILGAGRVAPLLPLPRWLAIPVAASMVSYLATAPFAAILFGQLAPASLVSNLLGVPLAGLILAIGYLSLLLSLGLGAGPIPGLAESIAALLQVARGALAIGPGPIWVAAPQFPLAALVGVGTALRAVAGGPGLRSSGTVCLTAAVLALHIGPRPPAANHDVLRLLDVGQGQSAWVQCGAGSLLIDAGGNPFGDYDPGARVVVPALRAAGVRRLAALAVSHGDTDHAGGVEAVLRAVDVGELWLGPDAQQSSRLRRLRELARTRGVALRTIGRERGETRVAGCAVRWFEVPLTTCAKSNDRSLVLRVESLDESGGSWLVPGDLERCGLQQLIAQAKAGELRSDILVVAHHGSRTGTSASWLERVQPDAAWVSAGFRNRFGHPHAEVRATLRDAGVPLRRTDREGTIELSNTRRGGT